MECLACHTPNNDGARFCAKCGAPLPVQKAADADPLIGSTVGGRYRITGVLGEGGMGRVYVGEQQMGTSVRKVAIKTLLAQFAKDPQTVARFMREVGTVSELEHPNTIKVFDFGQIEGSGELYIAMEMLQGTALDDALASGQPLSPERVDRIIGQVCGSLQEAHDKGIVHRDLKPANIFLTTRAGEEDVVKVLDFGIAKRGPQQAKTEQKLTQQGTILGTPPYMSPEQFTGKELDARSDIYSLGVVTYELLTGRLPYDAETPWQWMTQHMSGQPYPFETIPMAANVPHKMRQAVMHALAKDPNHRPATARDFFEELTLGGTRMSMVGLGSGGVGAMPTFTGQSGSQPRVAGTQMGTPLFAEGTPAGVQARTMGGFDMPPGGVPTHGGQAFPAPPQAAQKGGSGALIGIVAGVLVLGGAAGGFFYWRSQQDNTTASTSDTATATPTATETATTPRPTATTTTTATAKKTATANPTSTSSPPPSESEWSVVKEVDVTNGSKLGCVAQSLREWVRVLCRGKNDTGGKPKGLDIKKGSKGDGKGFAREIAALQFQFHEGTDVEVEFQWTDKNVTFKSTWPKGSPKPSVFGAFDLAGAVKAPGGAPPPPAPPPRKK